MSAYKGCLRQTLPQGEFISPEDVKKGDPTQTCLRGECDYIAGMTDNYCMEKYGDAFLPSAWSVK